MRTSIKNLVVNSNATPIGVVLNEVDVGQLSAKQLRQAIRNFGPGSLTVFRMPSGQLATFDSSADDFALALRVEIEELGGTKYRILADATAVS